MVKRWLSLRRARPIIVLPSCIFAIPVLAAPMTASDQASPLTQIQQHLRAVRTMEARFTQTGRNGRTLTGELTLKQPGKIRFQYQKGVPLLVVGDGKALTMIDYKVGQVTRLPIKNLPLSALLSPDEDLSKTAKVLPGNDGDKIVIEVRTNKHMESGDYTFEFSRVPSAPAGLMLQGWTVLDTQGNRTAVSLTEQRLNVAVSDKAFQWIDPRSHGR